MYRKITGFDGPTPHSIIYWIKSSDDPKRTVCYSAEEEEDALDRFHTPGDFYNSFDKARVDNGENIIEYGHLEKMGA